MSQVKSNKRVCFISSRTGLPTGSTTLKMDWANGRLIDELSKQIPNFSVAIIDPPGEKKSHHDFTVNVNRVYAIQSAFSYAGGLLNIVNITRQLKKIERENDVLIIQLPFIGFLSLLFIRKPVVYHICANVLTAAANPVKYRGIRLLFSRSFAFLMYQIFRLLNRRKKTKLVVNGEELYSLFAEFNPTKVVSSSIFTSEIISSAEIVTRSEDEPLRMIFIGRPSKEKGFDTLIAAFQILVDTNRPVSLTLLGVTKDELMNLIEFSIEAKYAERIQCLGFIPWGEKFKEIVKRSHCLIMSSVSEGTPRVLIESRALGCPVISTDIGGVTTSVTDGVDGLLFKPFDIEGLVKGVTTLFDENFRHKLIIGGLNTVSLHTVDRFADTFTEQISKLDER